MENIKCEECGKSFSRKYCVNRHYQNVHIKKKKGGHITSYTCDKCSKCVPSRQAFKKHWRRDHVTKSKQPKLGQRCPICKLNVHYTQLESHFFHQHQVELIGTEHLFLTEKEFIKWKRKIEKSTDSKFIVQVTRKKRTIRKYVCHRSGNFISTSKNIRHLKVNGSKKINGICPASIHFTKYDDGQVRVKFIETHVGHDCDDGLRYSNISSFEEDEIARKFSGNVQQSSILQNICQSHNGDAEREHLTAAQDVHSDLITEEYVIIEEIQNCKNVYSNEEMASKFNNILEKVKKSEPAARIYLSKMLAHVEGNINLLQQNSSCITIAKGS